MDLSKILSIGGKPGLFRLIGQTKSGFVVESLQDGKRMPAFPSQQVSTLEEISIYTTGEDLPLKDVFRRIFKIENGGLAPDHKGEGGELMTYFETVVPEFDPDLVRQSDIRKVYRWYNELNVAGLIDGEEDEKEESAEQNEEPATGQDSE